MGRRSINTTKSGKYMNPTDQARKEARKRELKKNKKQRMMVRQAVLKGKDPLKLLEDMETIDKMEFNPLEAPKLNEKVLKDKRKKLKETFDRVIYMYDKDDRERAKELKDAFDEYDKRRQERQLYYEQVKNAERVQVESIPLPDMMPDMGMMPGDGMPSMIPLPLDIPMPMLEPSKIKGILKQPLGASLSSVASERKRKPPGPPPGDPPPLSDSEDENAEPEKDEATEPPAKQRRKIRFEDDGSMDVDAPEKDTRLKITPTVKAKKAVADTPLHVRMLQMAGHLEHPLVQESRNPAPEEEEEEDVKDPEDLLEEIAKKEQAEKARKQLEMLKQQAEEEEKKIQEAEKLVEEAAKKQEAPSAPIGLPPGPPPGLPPGPPPGLPPMMFRPPPLRPGAPGAPPPMRLPPGPPPGRPPGMPPGPPPGMPRGMRPMPPQRMPPPAGGLPPPRLLRPPSGAPPSSAPPGAPPGANPTVLSAPAIIMKPSAMQDDDSQKSSATIEAKPKLKNLIGDATRFMPTALKVRRQVKDAKGRVVNAGPERARGNPVKSAAAPAGPAVQVRTKDDAYDQFMHEMESLL